MRPKWKQPASLVLIGMLAFGFACAIFFAFSLIRSPMGRDAKIFKGVNAWIDGN